MASDYATTYGGSKTGSCATEPRASASKSVPWWPERKPTNSPPSTEVSGGLGWVYPFCAGCGQWSAAAINVDAARAAASARLSIRRSTSQEEVELAGLALIEAWQGMTR